MFVDCLKAEEDRAVAVLSPCKTHQGRFAIQRGLGRCRLKLNRLDEQLLGLNLRIKTRTALASHAKMIRLFQHRGSGATCRRRYDPALILGVQCVCVTLKLEAT